MTKARNSARPTPELNSATTSSALASQSFLASVASRAPTMPSSDSVKDSSNGHSTYSGALPTIGERDGRDERPPRADARPAVDVDQDGQERHQPDVGEPVGPVLPEAERAQERLEDEQREQARVLVVGRQERVGSHPKRWTTNSHSS